MDPQQKAPRAVAAVSWNKSARGDGARSRTSSRRYKRTVSPSSRPRHGDPHHSLAIVRRSPAVTRGSSLSVAGGLSIFSRGRKRRIFPRRARRGVPRPQHPATSCKAIHPPIDSRPPAEGSENGVVLMRIARRRGRGVQAHSEVAPARATSSTPQKAIAGQLRPPASL